MGESYPVEGSLKGSPWALKSWESISDTLCSRMAFDIHPGKTLWVS